MCKTTTNIPLPSPRSNRIRTYKSNELIVDANHSAPHTLFILVGIIRMPKYLSKVPYYLKNRFPLIGQNDVFLLKRIFHS